jgi:hypothetical protein
MPSFRVTSCDQDVACPGCLTYLHFEDTDGCLRLGIQLRITGCGVSLPSHKRNSGTPSSRPSSMVPSPGPPCWAIMGHGEDWILRSHRRRSEHTSTLSTHEYLTYQPEHKSDARADPHIRDTFVKCAAHALTDREHRERVNLS